MKRWGVGVLACLLLAPAGAAGQNKDPSENKDKKLKIDFRYDYDPLELQEYSRWFRRWKRVVGPVGIGSYHVPPGRESGPFLGPPLQIFGHGFGTSLWRDPITGRPLY